MAFDDDIDGSSGGSGFDPKELLRTARDYWMLALVLAAPCAVGFYFWKIREEPVYRSNALILFELRGERVVQIEEVVDPTLAGGGEAGMENYLAHLRSRVFMEEVVDSLTSDELSRFTDPYRVPTEDGEGFKPVSAIGLLQSGFGVSPAGKGTTVRLSYEHRDPEMAATILRKLTDQFSIFLTRRAARANDAATNFLSAEAEELRQQVRESSLALQKYREENNVISLADSQNLVERQLSRVNEAASEAYLVRIQAEGTLQRTLDALESGAPIAKIPALMNYADVRSILVQINKLESEIAVLGLRYGNRHPTMVEKREILELTNQRLIGQVGEAKEYLSGQAMSAAAAHDQLVAEQKVLERESLKLDRLAIEYNVLQRRFESQKQTFDRIVSRLNETEISSKLVQSPVRIVDGASTPSVPIRPDRNKIMLTSFGFFGAIFGGIIGAFAFLDRRIRSSQIIEDNLDAEVLGEIPDLKGVREKERPRVVADNVETVFGEAFRSVAGKIMLVGRNPCPKSILFTSCSPGDGKSMLCANLAWSFHEQGKRVLLINADFRAPVLDELIVDQSVLGTTDWYQKSELQAVGASELGEFRLGLAPGLDFLPVGGETVKPQTILGDSRFLEAVNALSREYDYTLIDAPPGLVFHDAIALADWVDETVVVVRYLKATVVRLRRLMQQLDKTRSRKLGIVLNGLPAMQTNEGYYRHARRYYDRDGRRRLKGGGEKSRSESKTRLKRTSAVS